MAELTTKTIHPQTASSSSAQRTAPGLKFPRLFTRAGVSPYDEVEWEQRTASITDAKGNTIFEQRAVESPKDWSMTAVNIVASKYLHGTLNTPQRESGVRKLIERVAETIRDWGSRRSQPTLNHTGELKLAFCWTRMWTSSSWKMSRSSAEAK